MRCNITASLRPVQGVLFWPRAPAAALSHSFAISRRQPHVLCRFFEEVVGDAGAPAGRAGLRSSNGFLARHGSVDSTSLWILLAEGRNESTFRRADIAMARPADAVAPLPRKMNAPGLASST